MSITDKISHLVGNFPLAFKLQALASCVITLYLAHEVGKLSFTTQPKVCFIQTWWKGEKFQFKTLNWPKFSSELKFHSKLMASKLAS